MLYKRLQDFIDSNLFANFLLLIVIGNTITLSLIGLVKSAKEEEILDSLNIFFVLVFAFEMFMKISCFGLKSKILN